MLKYKYILNFKGERTMIDILGKTGVAALMFTLLYVSMLFLPNGQKIVDTINAKFFHRYTLITRIIMIFSCIGIIYVVFKNI